MYKFQLMVKKGEYFKPVDVWADSQEKAMKSFKMAYPLAEVTECQWIEEAV